MLGGYFQVMAKEMTLAKRLGQTCHLSSLRMKLIRLWRRNPGLTEVLEEWLIDLANSRGARIVTRNDFASALKGPNLNELTNEELVVGLLLPQNRDRPQMLRLAAQLISRKAVDFSELTWLATRERIEFILAAWHGRLAMWNHDIPSGARSEKNLRLGTRLDRH